MLWTRCNVIDALRRGGLPGREPIVVLGGLFGKKLLRGFSSTCLCVNRKRAPTMGGVLASPLSHDISLFQLVNIRILFQLPDRNVTLTLL